MFSSQTSATCKLQLATSHKKRSNLFSAFLFTKDLENLSQRFLFYSFSSFPVFLVSIDLKKWNISSHVVTHSFCAKHLAVSLASYSCLYICITVTGNAIWLLPVSAMVPSAKLCAFKEPCVETIQGENVLTWPHPVRPFLTFK